MTVDQNGDNHANYSDFVVPDLGTHHITQMSDEEFLAMFPHPSGSSGAYDPSTFNEHAHLSPSPAFCHLQHPALSQISPSLPSGEPPIRSNIPSLFVHARPGLTFPAASGSQPFTEICHIEELAQDMTQTMSRLRYQCTSSLNLLRRQHDASLKFYVDCQKERPGREGEITWTRYVDEMRLTYNMLRDYQMQAYKSICGALKIWIRYHTNFFAPATLQRWNAEMAGYIKLQRSVLDYKLPDWPNHRGLDLDSEDPFLDDPERTPFQDHDIDREHNKVGRLTYFHPEFLLCS